MSYSEIRYATNGIVANGLPLHSPLVGESGENEATGSNNSQANADFLGNLLDSDLNLFSAAGNLGSHGLDLDYYQFDVTYQDIEQIAGVNSPADRVSGIPHGLRPGLCRRSGPRQHRFIYL